MDIRAFVLALFLPMSAMAVLPPLWQSVAELRSILESPELKNHLESGETIVSIDKIDSGWQIKTNHSELIAEIKPLPQEMPGPMKFKILFHKN